MKKRHSLPLIAMFLCLLVGCGQAEVSDTAAERLSEQRVADISSSSDLSAAPGASTAAPKRSAAEDVEDATATAPTASAGGIDVDLTALSSTMVYSEVYNIITNPEDYIGKTVKMHGQFTFHENPSTKN